jgi:hypothetical protein
MPRIVSYANVASTLALLIALSGGAYAAASITGKDVKDRSLTGKDVRDRSLTGKDVKDRSLTGKDVKDRSLTGNDVNDRSLTGADLADASVTGADLGDGSVAAADLAPQALALPGATAAWTAGGPVPAGPQNEFTFDAESFDTGDMFSAPGGFVTIRRSGTYQVSGAISFADVSGKQVQTRIIVNGGLAAISYVDDAPAQVTIPASMTMRLTAGDQVTLGTYASTASAIVNFGSVPDAWLSVQMVSP